MLKTTKIKYLDHDGNPTREQPLSAKELLEVLRKQTPKQKTTAWNTYRQNRHYCATCGKPRTDGQPCCKYKQRSSYRLKIKRK
jgi:hypothetical protein